MMIPTDKRQFILESGIKALATRNEGSLARHFEAKLWELAASMPQGDATVITTNEKGIEDPYLLRVYLSPSRDAITRTLRELVLGASCEPEHYDMRVMRRVEQIARLAPRAYLHYFFRGDDDRAVHSHPWKRSLSLILLNGYVEHRLDRRTGKLATKTFRAGSVNYIRGTDYHKVELLPGHGTWTLFISTERNAETQHGHDWHFLDLDNGLQIPWVDWEKYRAEKAKIYGSDRDWRNVPGTFGKIGSETRVKV